MVSSQIIIKAKEANSLLHQNKLVESGNKFLELTKEVPDYAVGWQGLGLVHQKLDSHEKAVVCFLKAIQLDPNQPENYNSISASLRRLSRPADALASLVTGELVDKRIPRTLCNMSALLHTSGDRHIGSLASSEGLRRDPNFHQAKWTLAMKHMRDGEYNQGWPIFESRFDMAPDAVGIKKEQYRPWSGDKVKLALLKEQGLGDTIQMYRYIPQLERRTKYLVAEVPKGLTELFKYNFPNTEFVEDLGKKINQIDVDAHVAAMSLGLTLDIQPKTINGHAYLKTNPKWEKDWHRDIDHLSGLKVGVVWFGNARHHNDINRSLNIDQITNLIAIPGVTPIIVQMPLTEDHKKIWSDKFQNQVYFASDKIEDWCDTAVALKKLDVLVTVDTSVAHLAGALGVPTMMMVPYSPDWRWGLYSSNTFWYDSLRLYRQIRPKDWSQPFANLKDDLGRLVSDKKWPGLPSLPEARGKTMAVVFEVTEDKLKEAGHIIPGVTDENVDALVRKFPLLSRLWIERAKIAVEKKDFDKAISSAICALAVNPQEVGFKILVEAYKSIGRYDLSLEAAQTASLYFANIKSFYFAQAEAFYNLGRVPEAISVFKFIADRSPNDAQALTNLGFALKENGQYQPAEVLYRQALGLNPDNKSLRWNLAHLLLLQGKYQEGWDFYEHRWNAPGFTTQLRDFKKPVWDGSATKSSVLIHFEQGFGDAIQIARYFPEVSKRVGKLYIELDPALFDLFQQNKKLNELFHCPVQWVMPQQIPTDFDYQIPMMSLPKVLGMPDFQQAPFPEGYIGIDKKHAKPHKSLKVGIVWKGRPTHPHDKRRSLSLEKMSGLLEIPGIEFFSLQQRVTPDEEKILKQYKVQDVVHHCKSFMDTAKQLALLDAVVTVDTALAHLSGAMGIHTHIAVARVPDWRWGAQGHRTPWYRAAKVHRQAQLADWDSVIQDIKTDLIKMVDKSNLR